MALTEQVQLDIQNAQRQIDSLEQQLSDLSTPISVPVNVSGAQQLAQIRSELGLGEDAAEGLARELDQADAAMRDTGRTAGRAGDEIEDAGRRGASTFSRLATVVGGIVTALGVRGLFRSIIGAGFDRFTDIENATRALTIQLEDAAVAGQLLDDVLEVVTGTPFNFDQFAQAAQQLVGFGVEIERIPGILTAIGEAAATQGERAPEFVERLVTVFGQITTTGRVALEDINRIADTGVNALVILANAFGVTTEEMRAMISDGAVPAAEAIDILAEGIVEGSEGAAGATVALGGTMEGLRETLTGAIGGLRAAAARLGEAFFELIGAGTVEGVNQLTASVDLLTASVQGLGEVDLNPVIEILVNLPVAGERLAGGVSSGAQAVGNLGQAFGELVTLDPIGTFQQLSQAVDDFDDVQFGSRGLQAIQDLLTTISGGAEPVAALESALVELAAAGSLPDERLEDIAGRMVDITEAAGATGPELRTLADQIEEAGTVAGFSEPGVAILIDLLNELARDKGIEAQLDRDISGLLRLSGAARDVGPNIERSAEGVAEFRARVSEIRASQVAEEVEGIADTFGQLPDEMDAAAAALRDTEDEIVTDFTDFLSNLEEEIEARRAFRTNIAILQAMGLDDLAQVFTEEGLDAAAALADAVANPEEARRAEAALDAEAEAIGGSFRQTLIDAIEGTGLDLSLSADATIAINSLVISGLDRAAAQAEVGRQVIGEVGGVGGPGAQGGTVVVQNFEGFTPTPADLARAGQSANAVIN